MKTVISIIVCSIFLISCSANHHTRVKANRGLIEEKNRVERAIDLAKHSYALLYELVDPPYTEEYIDWDNDKVIKMFIRIMKGPVNIIGWKAEKYNDQTYIVFHAVEGENARWYFFDVNLKAGIVRLILPEQLESYGIQW